MNKRIVFAGIGLALITIFTVLGFAYSSNNPKLSDVSAPSINNASTKSVMPSFSNVDQLTNIGVTSDQVSNLERSLEKYLGSTSKNPTNISFDSLQQLSSDKNAATPIWTISFTVNLDNTLSFKAKMDYYGTTGIRLYLYGLDGTSLVYDTQYVGGSPEL